MKRTLLVLNPNHTVWMTERVTAHVQRVLGADAVALPYTAAAGPAVIDTPETFDAGALAVGPACAAALQQHPQAEAVLIACFGDPGLEALRASLPGRRVLGLAESAMKHAAQRHGTFAVLTCGPAWVDLLAGRAADWQLGDALVGVWALPVNGRELALHPERWKPELQRAADEARRAGARSLILGGAAFADLPPLIESDLPQVDALAAVAADFQRQAAEPR
jgi:Asp/Glu/hydantoin racemase